MHHTGAGGGHGGLGGNSRNNWGIGGEPYGDFLNPTTPGSGGYGSNGGAGGAALDINFGNVSNGIDLENAILVTFDFGNIVVE